MLPLSEFAPIFDGQTLPLLLGALFPFFGKPDKPSVSERTVEAITVAVHRFLEARGVVNFKVYTLVHAKKPVVLIQAEAQKKLRFSNIMEIQIKNFIREKIGKEVPAVFWRFKTDLSETPGPEQADYDERPTYPQDTVLMEPPTTQQAPETQSPDQKGEPATEQHDELYDVRHTTKQSFEVEEITLGEFDDFLKGTTTTGREDTK